MISGAAIKTILMGAGRALIGYALPPRCPGCGVITADDHSFCLTCWNEIEFLGPPQCVSCGEPFAFDPGVGARCGACLADPPAISGMAAAVSYGPIARRLALRLKYGGRPGLAETMARLMARHVTASDWLLAPVPLHRWRIWRRGYNQSALIAHALAKHTGQPVALDLIERRKATPILRGMGPAERARTVRGAFLIGPRHRAGLKGRTILLIDDVYTTGATVNACARTLRKAGAAEVHVLCWARVSRNEDGIR